MAVIKYLKESAINQLAQEGMATRTGLNKVIDYINTGGTQATVITDEVVELMGQPAATIKAATQYKDPDGKDVDLTTGKYAIDSDGVTHMFVADAALKGTEPEKQWHEINMGITQAQADARYLQIGVQEISPKIKTVIGFGAVAGLFIGDSLIPTLRLDGEFIIDFDERNFSIGTGMAATDSQVLNSQINVVQDLDTINVNDPSTIPGQLGGIPKLLNKDGTKMLWTFINTNMKANSFRFKRTLKANVQESAATWNDWVYTFVNLEPKIVPVEVYEIINPAKPMDELVSTETVSFRVEWPDQNVDTNGGAAYPGGFAFLDRSGKGVIESSSHQTGNEIRATAGGIEIWRGGSKQRGPYAWNTFKVVVTKLRGNALTSAGGSGMLMGQLGEIYDLENGRGVAHSADKVLNIQEIAELLKDQRDIDKNFMATFRDRITYSKDKEFTYDDLTRTQLTPGGAYSWEKSGLASYKVPVTVSGTSLTYDNLVNPYNRIVQEQASFEGLFKVNNMSVEYKFFSTNKALRFSGNVDQTYKWETFGKFENNARIPYIRFSGTGTMAIANDALNPVYTNQALPFEMKLADLMPNTDAGRTAIVKMNFGTLPAVGTEVMEIDYVTSTLFVENRFKNFLGAISTEVNAIKTDVTNKVDANLANANVGTANANKLPRVKADGTLEYIDNDLSTVNVGTGNVGKILRVKADGTLEYVETHDAAVTYDDNSTGIWKVIKG